ncbi:hypothetical protein NQ318_003731 [Aromia moschata]|uniref:HTH psq-type domain-containing protein n=1 Tax=Aromia moschata TaxID=1265417 RepID=A0AAV8XG38_9CUCU|nr:hypothetical protein NQ318_003731 [Aromia moschata]
MLSDKSLKSYFVISLILIFCLAKAVCLKCLLSSDFCHFIKKLTERERIEILGMIGFGDRIRTQKEVVELFNETHLDRHPFSQSMRNFGHVRDLPKSGRPSKSEEDQLNVLLTIQENHHSTLNQLASDYNMAASTVHKIMKKATYHPYK